MSNDKKSKTMAQEMKEGLGGADCIGSTDYQDFLDSHAENYAFNADVFYMKDGSVFVVDVVRNPRKGLNFTAFKSLTEWKKAETLRHSATVTPKR